MSKLGTALLGLLLLAATPLPTPGAAAAETAHHIIPSTAWGCHNKHDVFNLLFTGLSASFNTKLASALNNGRCVSFQKGETVTILQGTDSHGLVKVQRGAERATYWTPVRNIE